MANDAVLQALGKFITDDSLPRDAVHIAVMPVEAGKDLYSGQPLSVIDGKAYPSEDVGLDPIGVADPFLKRKHSYAPIETGQKFWLFLNPGSITSLVHHWTHPALDEHRPNLPGSKAASEMWLRKFAATADCPGYEELIAAALNPPESWDDDYLHFDGSDAHGEIPDEFWHHLEIVSGRRITHRPRYFSCSC